MNNSEQIVERLLSNKVRAFLYEEQNKITIEHYKYGLIDYFYKGDKIHIRNNNTWIELGMLWIRENLIINDIELYTRKELEHLIFKFSKDYIIDTTAIKEEQLKRNIEMFINIQPK